MSEKKSIVDLLNAVGVENVTVQFLGECVTNATATKPAGTVKVTFATNQMAVIDLIQPGEKVGVILWIPRKLLPGWMMPPKGKS